MLSMAFCTVDHLALHSGGLLSCSELVPRGKPLSRSHTKGCVGAPPTVSVTVRE